VIRIVKQPEERRQEILDTAQLLIADKGYEHTSVQVIVDTIGIAKGTFYHYFDSKDDLLIALIENLVDEVVASMEMLVQDQELTAPQKLRAMFDNSAEIKLARKPALEPLTSAFVGADSAVFREMAQAVTQRRIGPPLAEIINQGVGEGVFTVGNPDRAAQIVLQLVQAMGYATVPYIMASPIDEDVLSHLQSIISAYEEAITRILGAAPGSIKLIDTSVYERWFEMTAQE
jgi:AcrR family transcriptional regulator